MTAKTTTTEKTTYKIQKPQKQHALIPETWQTPFFGL